MKRYIREAKAKRLHGLFSKDPSTVYSQQGSNSMRADPPRAETAIIGRGVTQHRHQVAWTKSRPQQPPRTRTRRSRHHKGTHATLKCWTAPQPDMIHTYWLMKPIPFHERLTAQISGLLTAANSSGFWSTQLSETELPASRQSHTSYSTIKCGLNQDDSTSLWNCVWLESWHQAVCQEWARHQSLMHLPRIYSKDISMPGWFESFGSSCSIDLPPFWKCKGLFSFFIWLLNIIG